MAQVSLNKLVSETYRGVYGITDTASVYNGANNAIKLHAAARNGLDIQIAIETKKRETVRA